MKNFAVIALMLFSLNCLAKDKAVTVKTVHSVRRSILPIVCGYMDDNNKFQTVGIAGTGFIVDKFGRFITDDHVFNGWDLFTKRHVCAPAVYIPDDGWKTFNKTFNFQAIAIGKCYRDSTLDLAICELKVNPFTDTALSPINIAVVTFDTTEWPESTEVAFMGFPAEYTIPVTSIGHVAGLLSIQGINDGYDYILDKAAWPGSSGGPVFLADGKVIGIIRERGEGNLSGIAIGRSATVIVDFLSKHPVEK